MNTEQLTRANQIMEEEKKKQLRLRKLEAFIREEEAEKTNLPIDISGLWGNFSSDPEQLDRRGVSIEIDRDLVVTMARVQLEKTRSELSVLMDEFNKL